MPSSALAPAPLIAQFPPKLEPLFKPARYKVLYGGRGAGRSWGVARWLLLTGVQRPIRVLCARELQKSIAESVHKLLKDQIEALGLGKLYQVEKAKIYGPQGTEFSFEGIKNNVNAIKSYEGIDYCWVEEANKVSAASWGVLTPTIRKLGSEIILTFNPELEEDYTYQRFVLAPPANSIVVKMTYQDNPWFPEVLREDMEEDKARDYDRYLNIWEGFCLNQLEGAVYAKELRLAQVEERICRVPWDRETPVETFWDLGRRDMTSIWFAQRVAMQYRVLDFYEACGQDIQHFLQVCQDRPYTYGTYHLPHDAKHERLGMPRSIEAIIRSSGKNVKVLPKISIVDGINAARLLFPQCWFDEERCADGLNHLRRYSYAITDGQRSKVPLHDEHSHAADAFRYLAMALQGPKRRSRVLERLAGLRRPNDFLDEAPGLGWLG